MRSAHCIERGQKRPWVRIDAGRHRVDDGAYPRHVVVEPGDVIRAPEITGHPPTGNDHRAQLQCPDGRQKQASLPPLAERRPAAQLSLREHHVFQQTGQKEAFAGALIRRQNLPLQSQLATERRQHPVDRCSLLGSARQIDAAQQSCLGAG